MDLSLQLTAHACRCVKGSLVGLIGKQNIVKLFLNNITVDILWDTGANVSIISKDYINKLFPDIIIHSISEMLSDADKLQVRWGNQDVLPYEGFVEVDVALDGNKDNAVSVPFLLTPDTLQYPILGTNAINHLSKHYQSDDLANVLHECLPEKPRGVIESLVNFIHAYKPQDLSNVKTPKKPDTIPAGNQIKMKCIINRQVFDDKIPVAFEPEFRDHEDITYIPSISTTQKGIQNYITVPVVNRSNHDITIRPKQIIGTLDQVQAITPVEPVAISSEAQKQLYSTRNHHQRENEV